MTEGIAEQTRKGVGRFNLYDPDFLLLVVDLIGTFVFAVEGALAGINAELDVFGLLVLSFVTALGGGTIRDLLIGAIPPNSIRDWRYAATAFSGGLAVFCFHPLFARVPMQLMVTLDAAGLALFAVAGTGKALEFGITPLLAIMMGAVTGAGGGTVRDVLLAHVPGVLNSDVYAAAAPSRCDCGCDRRGSEDSQRLGNEPGRGRVLCAADAGGVAALESAEGAGALNGSDRSVVVGQIVGISTDVIGFRVMDEAHRLYLGETIDEGFADPMHAVHARPSLERMMGKARSQSRMRRACSAIWRQVIGVVESPDQ